MSKAKSSVLYLLLSLLGLSLSPLLQDIVPAGSPEILIQVGEDLVASDLSPDGRYLAGIGRGKEGWFLQVWDTKGREVLTPQPLVKPAGRYPGFDWSPDSRELAVSADAQVWVFEVKSKSKKTLAASPQVRTVKYDGPYLMARAKSATFVWKNSRLYWRLDQNYLLHSDLDSSSGRLATACFEDGVRVFDLKTKRQTAHFEPGATSAGVDFAQQGRLLASGFRNRGNRRRDHISTFDLETGGPAGPVLATPTLFGFQFSSDGRTVLSRQQSGALVWKVDDGRKIAHRKGHSTLIDALSHDGRWVATVPGGGTVSLWPTDSPNSGYELRHSQPVTDLRFPAPGRLLAVGGQASLWKVPED